MPAACGGEPRETDTMALRPILNADEHAALSEAVRGEYHRADDGKYVLDVAKENGYELTQPERLLNSVQATRAERDELDRKLREMQSRIGDDDLDELRQARERLRTMLADGDPDEKAAERLRERERLLSEQFAEKEAAIKRQHQEAIAEREARTQELEQRLDETVFENEATRAIREVDPEATIRFLLPELRGMTRTVRDQDGRRRIEVLDSNGTVRYESVDGDAQPMGLRSLVSELRKHPELGRAFSGGIAPGGGSGANQAGGPQGDGDNPFDPAHWNLTEQSKLAKANPMEAERLRKLAPARPRQPMIDRQPSGGRGTALDPAT